VSELFNKVSRYFGDYAVDKRLAYDLELTKLPRYVAEFLISEFKERGEDWDKALIEFVRSHYYEPEEKDLVKHKLVSEGTVRLIDELRAYVDVETGAHIGVIHSLDIYAEVPPDIADKYKALLTTGMWGLITLTRIETGGALRSWSRTSSPSKLPTPTRRSSRRPGRTSRWKSGWMRWLTR
jgi:ATP-dependent Lon protease